MSLKIKELSKSFGEHVAVKQLSLEVEKGKYLVYWDAMEPENPPPSR